MSGWQVIGTLVSSSAILIVFLFLYRAMRQCNRANRDFIEALDKRIEIIRAMERKYHRKWGETH